MTTLFVFGEMGNGKSTLCNSIAKHHCWKLRNTFSKKKKGFKAEKSATAVTDKVQRRTYKDLIIIDSPGLNDPDKKRSDAKTYQTITDVIR